LRKISSVQTTERLARRISAAFAALPGAAGGDGFAAIFRWRISLMQPRL
jgi:hypothetical protein